MQENSINHTFKPNSYFEDVIERYNFDKKLRLILFDAIEYIEIALRTKMIYHLSLNYGGLWYLNSSLFDDSEIYENTIKELEKEFLRSQEIFIKDQRNRYPNENADAWKILEVASFGTLSKLYKNLKHQLPEKSLIAKEMGLNLNKELSSWLESIGYVRNIVAHHSRLLSRNMVKKPIEHLKNSSSNWFSINLLPVQTKKPFLIISCMIYICNNIEPNNDIKSKLLKLFEESENVPIYKLGFLNNWNKQPIWE